MVNKLIFEISTLKLVGSMVLDPFRVDHQGYYVYAFTFTKRTITVDNSVSTIRHMCLINRW